MTANPFETLGLPVRRDLDDEQVRAAWRAIAAATHPDRPDGGDLARYTAASAAFAKLRTGCGRSEAYADVLDKARLDGLDPEDPVTSRCLSCPPPTCLRTRRAPCSRIRWLRRGSCRPGSAAAGPAACSCAPSSPPRCRCWS